MNTEIVIIKPEPGVGDSNSCDESPTLFETSVQIKQEISIKVEPADESNSSPSSLSWDDQDLQQQNRPDDEANNTKLETVTFEMPDTKLFESAMRLASGVIIPDHFLTTFAPAPLADQTNCCTICDKKFATQTNLQRHLLIHTKIKHSCGKCDKQFYKIEQLEKHAKRHETKNERKHPCDICGKKFKSTSNLVQHKRTHLTVKPFLCDLCDKTFTTRANLIKHHGKSRCKKISDEPLICKVCNKEFQKEFLLRSHLKKHETERPYFCDLCGMNFKYKSAITRHLQWHTGYRPHKCKFCGKKFTHSGLLKPHMRVHTGEKPYQCPICLRFFAHKHNMERHKINHGRIKRLVCDICNKKFPRESRLIYHMRTHTNEKHFQCHICLKRFSHKQNVLRHFERKHPGSEYLGTDTDAKVALKVWDKVKHSFEPHFDMYQQPEEIIG